jgi:hypothetical protein
MTSLTLWRELLGIPPNITGVQPVRGRWRGLTGAAGCVTFGQGFRRTPPGLREELSSSPSGRFS